MRIGHAMAVAAFLAATPAMAQYSPSNNDYDQTQHHYRADQDRSDSYQGDQNRADNYNADRDRSDNYANDRDRADNDRYDHDRAMGRQDMDRSRTDADRGDYRSAQRDQYNAQQNWRATHHDDHDADHNGNGGVTLHFGQ